MYPVQSKYHKKSTFFAAKVPEIKNVQGEAYIAINRVNEMKHLNLSCEFQLTFQVKTQARLLIDQMRGNCR